MPSLLTGFRDIIELKRPNMELLQLDTSHNNYYFAAEVSKAIGQCHRYLDMLHKHAEKGLDDYPHVLAYHPTATIVIGRSRGWPQEKLRALHGLNSRLHKVRVMTFDHLLAQGERLLEIVTQPSDDTVTQPSDDEAW